MSTINVNGLLAQGFTPAQIISFTVADAEARKAEAEARKAEAEAEIFIDMTSKAKERLFAMKYPAVASPSPLNESSIFEGILIFPLSPSFLYCFRSWDQFLYIFRKIAKPELTPLKVSSSESLSMLSKHLSSQPGVGTSTATDVTKTVHTGLRQRLAHHNNQ